MFKNSALKLKNDDKKKDPKTLHGVVGLKEMVVHRTEQRWPKILPTSLARRIVLEALDSHSFVHYSHPTSLWYKIMKYPVPIKIQYYSIFTCII